MNIDPRGPRFGAAITTVVLAIVLVTESGWLLLAQTLVFAIGALAIAFAAGSAAAGLVFAGLALAAAFLNAVFDLCLGCQMYLLIRRIRPAA